MRAVPALALLVCSNLLGRAQAAESLLPQATELGQPDAPIKIGGFLQPQVDWMLGDPVQGLKSPGLSGFNGDLPAFNTVGGSSQLSFRLFRARLGARGSMPGTDQRINWFTLFEFGEVPITRASPVVPTDLSVTFSYIPGARIRVGQFKLPVMEEIVPPLTAFEWVHFSNTFTGLLSENRIVNGAYVGGAYAFRDVGIQVFDGFQQGALAGGYALMLSNGDGILSGDTDGHHDLSGRFELAWVLDGERTDPRRQEVKVGAWRLQGKRDVGNQTFDRVRQGVFLHVEIKPVWALIELASGQGMLETGSGPPFAGGTVGLASQGEAWGIVGQGGMRLDLPPKWGELGLKLRYDRFDRQTEDAVAERIFQTMTGGVEYDPVPKLRLQANYEWRTVEAPGASGDALVLADAMGDRVTVQVTARF